ncbi:MAG: hypothetical protein AAF483_26755 [Planctomycetota bacterium]
MKNISRREALTLTAVAATATAAGCNSSKVGEAITKPLAAASQEIEENLESASTEDLKGLKLALRGYEIVSMAIVGRIVFLPYPGMRIVSVMIVATAATAKLAVKYIDDELMMRKLEEPLSEDERSKVEFDGHIAFATASGLEQREYLAPTVYEEQP